MSTAASPSIRAASSHRLTPLRDLLVLAGAVEAMTFLEHLDELRRRLVWSIVFQIPAVIFVLSRAGLVTAGLLVRYFKHSVVASVVLAAVLTPTTDFGNMLIVAGPMIALYAVGIGIAFVFGRS